MGYYQLEIADVDPWHLAVAGDKAPLNIWACNYLEMPPPMRFLVSARGKKVDYSYTGWLGIPIVSRRMADCLDSLASNDIQRIPAIISGEPKGEWEVINILARPDCISYDKSNVTYYPSNHPEHPGKPRGFLKLIIDPRRVEGHNVFRPKDWENAFIVSEALKNLLEAVGITDVEYWPVTEY